MIFHCANQARLDILDVNEGRVTRQIPVAEPKVFFAAGMNDLLVALPNAHIIQRWGLLKFERLTSAPVPFKGAVTGLCMGSGSQGPLLVCEQVNGQGVGSGHFVDVATLKPLSVVKEGQRLPGIVPALLRASGDGHDYLRRAGPQVAPSRTIC